MFQELFLGMQRYHISGQFH